MTKTLKQQNENALTIVNDNDLAALADAARDLLPTDIVGLPLRYVKHRWFVKQSQDQEVDVGPSEPYVADMLSYQNGWRRWQNRKPTHTIIGRRIDGFISPPRNLLPECDPAEWPVTAKGPQDPWQEFLRLVLRNQTTDQLVTFESPSWGGQLAMGELLDVFVAESKKHPGEMPVVLLTSYDRSTADFGPVPTPRFKIVDWQPFGPDASPPGDPAQGKAMRRALEQLQTQTLALPKPSEPAKRQHGDMDDAIPF